MNKINVTANNNKYDIIIENGAIKRINNFLLNHKKYSKIFIITDENLANIHLDKLIDEIHTIKIAPHIIKIKAGEQSKSFANLQEKIEDVIALQPDRKSLIIAFGGGVVGDFAGFMAAILLRGIDFIQIPTTLLAMVDSSVGGKTAINSKYGKNLIGAFYQPQLVLCDIDFLKSLPIREMRAGYAEVLKYGIALDKNFFDFLEANYEKIYQYDNDILQYIIAKSCEIKSKIVSQDEKEQNIRALLNFGHTFGHLFEAETNYSDLILHGEAVAIGMAMAITMSFNLGFIDKNKLDVCISHLKNAGFIIDPKKIKKDWNINNLTKHLLLDKKIENGNLTFILLSNIGQSFVKNNIAISDFNKIMTSFLN
jgi:3-dehydroquinate synthase